MKCKWSKNDGTKNCQRATFRDSEFCLFHKPKKNNEESLIFWAVINFDPFCAIRGDLRNIFYENISGDFGENIDVQPSDSILRYFIKIGIVTYNINPSLKSILEHDIAASVNQYLQSSGVNPILHETVFEQWKVSGLHGLYSGSFIGLVFPSDGIFNYKYCRLNQMNTFVFEDVIFENICWFENYNFGKNHVSFINVKINNQVSFENTHFGGNVIFNNTGLMTGREFNDRYPFYNARFEGQHLTFLGGSISNLYGIKVSENTNLIILDDVKVNPVRFGGMMDPVMINAEKETFLIAKNQAEKRGEYSLSSKYLYLEKRAERKQIINFYKQEFRQKRRIEGKVHFYRYLTDKQFYSSTFKTFWNYLSDITIGYGEKPVRALMTSGLFIVIYGLLYFILDILKDSSFGSSMFFSIVTFTTVGYGNNYPIYRLGEILSASEMFIGVTFIAIWTATIIRKMMK